MAEKKTIDFEEFREQIISNVENEISDSGESSKIVYLREILTYLDGITSEWEEDPDYYIDDRIQASHHSENWESLDILISDYHGKNITMIPPYASPVVLKKRFKDAKNFIGFSMDGGYTDIDESDELHSFSKSVYEHSREIKTIRYILITDLHCQASLPDEVMDRFTVKYLTWSLEDIYKLDCSEKAVTDKLEINFEDDFGEKIPCLKVDFGDQDMEYSSYLGIIKGSLLAALYETYNERLLEGNIRVFLQTTTSVNKGIIATLSHPHEKTRFFAYNNGISATAEEVFVTEPDENGYRWIKRIRGLQIVNGGQTTASIHTAWKKDRKNADGVYIQMKLTIPESPSGVALLNEKIAQYSNTQNQIKKADFTANDPYQVRIEKLSRSVRINTTEMGWFYERIRGQYAESKRLDELNNKGRKKNQSAVAFETRYPKSRRLTKTDVALHYNAWNQYPYYAAKGGEKNYQKFMSLIENEEGEISIYPDERYFHELIAMSILFIRTDTMVNEWQKGGGSTYGNGYKREILLYTLSLLSYLTAGRLDLEKIWKSQSTGLTKKTFRLPDVLEQYIRELIPIAEYHIRHPPSHKSDAREWAKTEEAWRSLRDGRNGIKHVPVPDSVIKSLYLTNEEVQERMNWLSSLNKEKPDNQEEELGTDDAETPISVPETDFLTEQNQPETAILPPPNFRKIILTSSYSDWSRIISGIIEAYELAPYEVDSLQTIKKRKSTHLQPLDIDVKIIAAAFSRLFEDSIEENDPEYLRTFGIDPAPYFPVTNDAVSSGGDIRTPLPLPPNAKIHLETDSNARGILAIRNKQYVLLKGAIIDEKLSPEVPRLIIQLRNKLQSSGKLYYNPSNYNQYILAMDLKFPSPDMAESFITGVKAADISRWKCNDRPITDYDI